MNERDRLERELSRNLGRCVMDFSLLSEGDRVMVCLSGGKDSYTLYQLLERLRTRSPVHFDLVAVHLDQGHPGYDGSPLEGWLRARGADYRIVREDTYSIVKEKLDPDGTGDKTYCSLCSRLRRGVLYNLAEELGCQKIALGHHRDDAIETLLLNQIFAGSIKAMPPKLVSDDLRNVVIRPLLYCAEKDIARFAELEAYPILPCDLCGSQEHLMRQEVKRLLTTLEAIAPRVRESMLAALGNVRPTHLLDRGLYERLGLHATGSAARVAGDAGSAGDAAAPSSDDSRIAGRPATLLRADGRSLPVVGEG